MLEQPEFVINLHGIGRPSRAYELGEEKYWLSELEFENLLDFIVDCQSSSTRIRLTFDDGNMSDYSIVAPRLRTRAIGATFFILAGKIGKKGYLSDIHIQQLSNEGFEIGSHGLNHVAWTRLRAAELRREVEELRAILETITGSSLHSLSIPFGAYNRNVIRELKQLDFRNVFSSDGGARLTTAIPTPRLTIKKGLDTTSLCNTLRIATGLSGRLATETRLRLKQFR